MSPGRIATLACCLEVAAPKPGNVHRGADFEDVTLEDFLTSAVLLGQVIDDHVERALGETIFAAVTTTIDATGTNTNLGMVLLLVPLAKAMQGLTKSSPSVLTRESVAQVLSKANSYDAGSVFAAIRLAKPGGLGTVPTADVNLSAVERDIGLLDAMELAAARDLVARQYVSEFGDVFEFGVAKIIQGRRHFNRLSEAIVFAHIAFMSEFPDSLIARKCGSRVAEHSQMLAVKTMEALESDAAKSSEPVFDNYWNAVRELDFWLRSDGHKRNPGTTADMIAASLFVAIANGQIDPPFR